MLHIAQHPLVGHLLAEARRSDTPPHRFRVIVASIGAMLAYEATRDLPTRQQTIRTPLETTTVQRLAGPLCIIPVLRAGLGLAQGMIDLLPEAHVGHIGIFRDEKSLSPVSYYHKIPIEAARGVALLADPMLATGGSALAAIDLLHRHGCTDVRVLCLVAAPEGLGKVRAAHPTVPIFAAALDRQLNDRGFILPGLGDAGDRLFGTTG